MVWKTVTGGGSGTSTTFGGDDGNKISQLFSGTDVDDVIIGSDFGFKSDKLRLWNPAETFYFKFTVPAITGSNKTINIPSIGTTSDTMQVIGMNQTITSSNIYSNSQKMDNYIDLKEITEPSSPGSGYVRYFIDSTNHLFSAKHSNGSVTVFE